MAAGGGCGGGGAARCNARSSGPRLQVYTHMRYEAVRSVSLARLCAPEPGRAPLMASVSQMTYSQLHTPQTKADNEAWRRDRATLVAVCERLLPTSVAATQCPEAECGGA